MSISGAIFFATSSYIALIAAAFIGTINVTGTEMGAFHRTSHFATNNQRCQEKEYSVCSL
jgi:hypothetical protein